MAKRQLVIINQASNYLTIGFANAFNRRFDQVVLMTGSVHQQGEALDEDIRIQPINRWHERPAWKKGASYVLAMVSMWFLLMTRYRKHEVLFISVPPMAYLLNLFLPHRFSMVIWDVYPDVLKIAGKSEQNWVYKIWSRLNRLSFKKAFRLFTISDPMARELSQYVDSNKICVHPIWSIDHGFKKIPAAENSFIDEHGLSDWFVVQYSGNIGLTHNVEVLIELAKRLEAESRVLIQIIGRGPRKPYIEALVKERKLSNVQFLPFQSDAVFPFSLSAADVGVVVLHDSVSRGSVPSKAYNIMKFGIPSLYVASSESELANYSRKYRHAGCFESKEIDGMARFIVELFANKSKYKTLSKNAFNASKTFQRSNAERFVIDYFDQGAG